MSRRGAPALLVLAMGCAAPASPPAARHEVRGQLLAVQLDTRQVLLKHEAIPGVMDAMTMPFTVADRRALRDRRPGDLVTATLVVEPERSYLEALTGVGTAPLPGEALAPAAAAVPILMPGDATPTLALTGDRGQPVSIADWKGDVGVVTFIYTRCPLPDFCPWLDRRFAAIQDAADAEPALRGRVHLLSVSFDPDVDTPSVLRAHAERVGAGRRWRFAVAPAPVVDRFAAAFGVTVIREADGTITHNLRTAVVGSDGRIVATYSGNDWTPEQVLADLRRAFGAPPS